MTATLTPEASKILKAAAEGGGIVAYVVTFGGPSITVGGREMIPHDANHRAQQLWIGGLEDLQRYGYVRDRVGRGELFDVTREGYQRADQPRAGSGKPSA